MPTRTTASRDSKGQIEQDQGPIHWMENSSIAGDEVWDRCRKDRKGQRQR